VATGAVIGAAAGYLVLTEEGRLIRRRLAPIAVDLFAHAMLLYEAGRRTDELLQRERVRPGTARS
jgi:hypothetical protein